MEFSGTDLRLVDPLAADLIYFDGSMPMPRFGVTPARTVLGAIFAAAVLVAMSPMARAAIHTASGVPSPTPTPMGANIVLDTAAGGPNTRITATGSAFLPGESMNLIWDAMSHVAATVTADGGGNFTKVVTPFPGDVPGIHRLCASVQPIPCAYFTLQGAPTPTPPAAPSPSPSTTPSDQSPSPTTSASSVVLTHSGRSGLDIITKPPFVFLPIIGLLALLAALAYWLLMRVDRTPVLPSASVVHRSARPDIGPLPTRPPAPGAEVAPPPVMHPPPADFPPPAVPPEHTSAAEDAWNGPAEPHQPPEPPEPSA